MTPDDCLVRFALELKYNTDIKTRDMIKTLYTKTTGKTPSPKKDLLKWFWQNFEFDGTDTWYHRDRALPN